MDTLPGTPDPEAVPGFWIGRKLLIETRPTERDAPRRRHVVEIDEPVEVVQDLLVTDDGGDPTTATRLHWRAEDALPFELDLTVTYVSANLVPATAGPYGARSRRDRQPAIGPSGAPDHGRARRPATTRMPARVPSSTAAACRSAPSSVSAGCTPWTRRRSAPSRCPRF